MKIFPVLILLFATGLFASDLSREETSALIARVAEKRRGIPMQADFREEKHLALMARPVIEIGTIAFSPPDKFRREVPGKSLTVCDGQTLWLYYPRFNEVEKYVLSSNRALRESLAAMTSGFGLQDLDRDFAITASESAGGYRLTLTPKNSRLRKSITSITVDLSAALNACRLEILGAQEDRTITTFSNERKSTLPASAFEFQPPAGTSVSEPMK